MHDIWKYTHSQEKLQKCFEFEVFIYYPHSAFYIQANGVNLCECVMILEDK